MSQDSLAVQDKLDSSKFINEYLFGNEWMYDTKIILPEDQKKIIDCYVDSLYLNNILNNDLKGKVILNFKCNEEGTPEDIAINLEIPKNKNLGMEAINVLKSVKFIPATRDNKPVTANISFRINFEPPKNDSE